MRKYAKISVFIALLAMAGSGFFYVRSLTSSGGDDDWSDIVVYTAMGAGLLFLLGLVLLLLTSGRDQNRADAEHFDDEGDYDPYGDEEEYEDEEEDEYVR